jgi:hypothetical protein
MTDLLAENGFVVSGHPMFAEMLGLSSNVVAVLRHFRLYSSGYPQIFILTLDVGSEGHDNAIEQTADSVLLNDLVAMLGPVHILAYGDNNSGNFALPGRSVVTSPELQAVFASIDERFVQNVGTAKPINRTSNDRFVDWTRSNIARQCVVNDVDALKLPSTDLQGELVELKRPKQHVKNWAPYTNDARNYESQDLICRSQNLVNKTITYNLDQNEHVRLDIDVRWEPENQLLTSRFVIAPPSVAIRSKRPASISMNPHTSRR